MKEKQLHIEQLLKERDLERADVLKAANQAEEAEQRLTSLHQEYMKVRNLIQELAHMLERAS